MLNRIVLRHIDASRLFARILDYYKPKVFGFWQTTHPEYTEAQLDYLFEALVGTLSCMVEKWIRDDSADAHVQGDLQQVLQELGFLGLFC